MRVSLFQFSVLLLSIAWLSGRPVFAADAIPGEDFCDGNLDRVAFEGNNRTLDYVLLRQTQTRVGSPCSLDEIIDSRQSIMDLRLFKSVSAGLSMQGDLRVLTYTVVEKIYFLPLPRFSRTSDGELRYGVQLRWDNFRGRHHQVKVTTEQRRQNNGTGREGELHEIKYVVPRILGSDFGFEVELRNAQQQTQLKRDDVIFGESNSQADKFGLSFSRWSNQTGTTRGLSYSAGITWQQRTHRLQSGELGPFEEGHDLLFRVGAQNQQERDDLYRIHGYRYGGNLYFASTNAGSDYSYHAADIFYIRYMRADKHGLRNFNYRFRLGYSNGGPFGERLYSLGGGDLHRGLKPGDRDGDVLTLFNAEYLIGLNRYPAFRWALFTDVGNVYEHNDIDLTKQVIGVGVGARWKILALSNTDLRVDLAHSAELDKPRFYLSSSLTF